MSEKQCKQCLQVKPLSKFKVSGRGVVSATCYVCSKTRDHDNRTCEICQTVYGADWRNHFAKRGHAYRFICLDCVAISNQQRQARKPEDCLCRDCNTCKTTFAAPNTTPSKPRYEVVYKHPMEVFGRSPGTPYELAYVCLSCRSKKEKARKAAMRAAGVTHQPRIQPRLSRNPEDCNQRNCSYCKTTFVKPGVTPVNPTHDVVYAAPSEMFGANKSASYGLAHVCKPCALVVNNKKKHSFEATLAALQLPKNRPNLRVKPENAQPQARRKEAPTDKPKRAPRAIVLPKSTPLKSVVSDFDANDFERMEVNGIKAGDRVYLTEDWTQGAVVIRKDTTGQVIKFIGGLAIVLYDNGRVDSADSALLEVIS